MSVKTKPSSIYYPSTPLDSISAQNQPYPSSKYYPYPDPKNTFRLNPLVLKSLKNLDIDDLQDVFGKGIQEEHMNEIGRSIENKKMFDEDSEIQEIRQSIEYAKLNKIRALQMHQNQMRRVQNLIKDTEADEQVLKKLKEEKIAAKIEEEKKKQDRILAKKLIQQQILDKEKIKIESEKEYKKDLNDMKALMENLKKEDLENQKEIQRKRDIAQLYMKNAYAEKAERLRKQKEEENLQKEREKKYEDDLKNRENEQNSKKAKIQFEKDKIFDKLCKEEAERQAVRDYWEQVRNDLYTEQENKKAKMKELAEKEKLHRQKEDMMNSAILQRKIKEENLKKEKEIEEEFKKKLMEKFKDDEKIEQMNKEKRKMKEIEMKKEIEKQWQLKLQQYQLQKEREIAELEKLKKIEDQKKYLIEQEKKRLIKENETLLKSYYPFGYNKAVNSLKNISPQNQNEKNKNNIIFNNIFGNSNPNKASAYPKYGKIKNFVYDVAIQDVHPKINMVNYLMYNATANNNYDSYPSPEEYKKMMEKNGQINYAYAGNNNTTGIPLRSQLPKFIENRNINWVNNDNDKNMTQYHNFYGINKGLYKVGRSNSMKDLNANKNVNNDNYNTINGFYSCNRGRSFKRNIIMQSTNPNGIHAAENYQQTIQKRIEGVAA